MAAPEETVDKQGTSNSSPFATDLATSASDKMSSHRGVKRSLDLGSLPPQKRRKGCPILKIEEAGKLLRAGEVVAFPTETVFGLGADATSNEAVSKIYKAKGRPSDNPLIVHIADLEQLTFVEEVSPTALLLANKFWPGPLSIVFNHKRGICETVRAGLNTVAVRMPNHPVALELLRAAQCPIAAPSANISGKPSPTRTAHVVNDLHGRIAGVVPGESCAVGVESTVVKLVTQPNEPNKIIILRPGGITKQMLEDVVGEGFVDFDKHLISEDETPLAPGMKYKHYSPEIPLVCITGSDAFFKVQIQQALQRHKDIGVILTDENENLEFYKAHPNITVSLLGSRYNLGEVCQNLFDCLRTLDQTEATQLFSETLPNAGLGFAFMNRLTKAANNSFIIED